MKQVFNTRRREEAGYVKRILEEHLLPCLLVTDGEGAWKLFLNVAIYDTEYPTKATEAERLIREYGYTPFDLT